MPAPTSSSSLSTIFSTPTTNWLSCLASSSLSSLELRNFLRPSLGSSITTTNPSVL